MHHFFKKSLLDPIAWMIGGMLALVSSVEAADMQPAKRISICAAEGHPIHMMAADTITEAYRRIGYTPDFVWLPNRRSLKAANDGGCGAELMRIDGVQVKFPYLYPIKVPVTFLEGVVFMNMNAPGHPAKVTSWSDLKHLNTYIILGEVYAERGTQNMAVEHVKSYEQMFKILARGGQNVGVGIREMGLLEIAKHHPDSAIQINSDALARLPMYHYVHRDNVGMIPALQNALQTMSETGVIKTLNQNAMARMLSQP